jgi:ligand-binding sensor domain-containing protein
MKLRTLLLALVVSASAAPVATAGDPPSGQAPVDLGQYVHDAWTRAQGLPQDSVNAVLQTRDGYLWLGTQEGLVRFDGVKFTLFNKSNIPAFKHKDVFALAESPDGSLWVGTFGGLVQWKAGEFTAHPTGQNRERDVTTSLAVGIDGSIWAGTQQGGLNWLRGGRFEFLSSDTGLASNGVDQVAVDATGAVWVATTGGLSTLRDGRWHTYRPGPEMAWTTAWCVLPTRDGRVWVGTDRGLGELRDGAVRTPAHAAPLAGRAVRALFEDRSGALWAGTDAGVVWRYANGAWSSLTLAPDGSGNFIRAFAEDREGSIWIGTYSSGLHRLWRGKFTHITREQGLGHDYVRTILQTRDGHVWIATEASGVSRFDGRSLRSYTTKDGLAHETARSFFEDARGVFWVGTRDGLSRFDGQRFRTQDGTRGDNIRAIAEDRHGTLWVGTVNRGVLRLVDGRLVDVAEDDRTKLPGGVVRSLFRDRDGTMWIGTNEALTRWDGRSLTVLPSADGLPLDAIYCLYQDRDGTIWLGSYGGGLIRMKDGHISRITQADGLFDDVVYQILEDGSGNLWLSCNNGISRVSKRDLDDFAAGRRSRITSVAYDSSDGMLSTECNGNVQPAGWKTSDGRLWFPTTRGVVIIDPANLRENRLAPLVAIEGVIVNSRPYAVAAEAVAPPGPGNVELEFTGLGFIAPHKVRFRYQLEGYDREWVDAGVRRQTIYTNLPPKRYVFRVMASNRDGVWSENPATFSFVLRPYFYQTWWFQGLGLLALAGAAFGVYRLRVWQHVRRERELTHRVDQALSSIKILGGLIPICASCKKIRDDKGYWSQLELYLKSHSEATLSHGICPDCMVKLYPEYSEDTEK